MWHEHATKTGIKPTTSRTLGGCSILYIWKQFKTLLPMSSRSSVDRVPALCSGGHGFDSCRGLNFFSLPHVHVMLISLLFRILLLSVIPNVWPVKTFSSILFICILLFMFRRVFQPLNVVDKQYLHIIIKVNLILS